MTRAVTFPAGCELRSSLTSPFGRKLRMALVLADVQDQVALHHSDTTDPADVLRRLNPLGKLPSLVLPDGRVLFDSRVILSWLDATVPDLALFPADPDARALEETRLVLADGITDAALLIVYEDRFREPSQRSERWLAHQRGKIDRALAAIVADLPPIETPCASTLALAAALDYLDWRKPVPWRPAHPELVSWLDAFGARHPALAATNGATS